MRTHTHTHSLTHTHTHTHTPGFPWLVVGETQCTLGRGSSCYEEVRVQLCGSVSEAMQGHHLLLSLYLRTGNTALSSRQLFMADFEKILYEILPLTRWCAPQCGLTGQVWQGGDCGVHTVAPSSMSAWLKSPGLPGSTASDDNCLVVCRG